MEEKNTLDPRLGQLLLDLLAGWKRESAHTILNSEFAEDYAKYECQELDDFIAKGLTGNDQDSIRPSIFPTDEDIAVIGIDNPINGII